MKNMIGKVLVLGFLITALLGCSNNKTEIELSKENVSPTTVTATNVADRTDKIKFKTEGGSDLFALKQQADGAKLVDGNDQELARIKADKSGKIKIKNASDKVLGYVVTAKGYWKLENPEQSQDLYILRRQNDGNYQLENAAKKEIYQIKTRKDGWGIETPDKKLVYQVRIKAGKTSLRNASANTVFSTKSEISPIAFTCFGLDVLTREQQAALAYAVNLTGGQ
ncbi:MAG: hypothetical protein KME59_02225 [Trichormus sp. ATA11-4-KO1]|nr:hypothetical protein [Trichormus sp. ATA11-4-KO1]